MNLSNFTFQLLLLFFPGIIAAILIDQFTVHRERTPFFFLIYSFVLGLASYFIYWLIYNINNFLTASALQEINFFKSLFNPNPTLNFTEVAIVTLLSVVLAILVVINSTYKLHIRAAHLLKITRKFGDLDVWGFVFNSQQIEYATVRNYSKDLMYDGWVKAFSDGSENAELLLGDVIVYQNSTRECLYEVEAIYLSLERDNIEIEFRESANEVKQSEEK